MEGGTMAIQATVENGVLTIKADLDKAGVRSASGKTLVLASTRGNVAVPDGNGGVVFLGLNVYRKG